MDNLTRKSEQLILIAPFFARVLDQHRSFLLFGAYPSETLGVKNIDTNNRQ